MVAWGRYRERWGSAHRAVRGEGRENLGVSLLCFFFFYSKEKIKKRKKLITQKKKFSLE